MLEWVFGVVTLMQVATSSTPQPFDPWQILDNATIQGTINIAGLSLLVILFSRDLILTKGQHERRVADLNKSHAAELQAKDDRYNDMIAEKIERYVEMKESRNYYREARSNEQDRSRTLTDQLVESNKGLQVAARALGALEQAVPGGGS